MASLVVYRSGKVFSTHPVQKKLLSVGRSAQCDVVLPESDVSSLHCNLLSGKDDFQVVDLNSTNGTFLNGNRVTESALRHNDVLGIGSFLLRFETEASTEKTAVIARNGDYLRQSHELVEQIKNTQVDRLLKNPGSESEGRAIEKSLQDLDAALSLAERSQRQYRTMFELAEAINTTKGFRSVLEVILNKALEVTGLKRGAIVLFSDEEVLEPVVSAGLEREAVLEDKKAISYTVIRKAIDADEITILKDAQDATGFDGAQSIVTQNIRATICLPLKSRSKKVLGALYMDSQSASAGRDSADPEFLRLFGLFTATAIETRQAAQREKKISEELAAAKERDKYNDQLETLAREKDRLEKLAQQGGVHDVLGTSPVMRQLFQLVQKVGPVDVPILITGETGTGKSLLAKSIHMTSERKTREFVTIDCASIPSELLESELFGYERGAFTGAVQQKKGRVEMAAGGTLFLDEIGDMSLKLQAKLLRFLQDKSFERVGGTKTLTVDLRVIAATNKNLKKCVAERIFREDLYYRLCGISLHMPPLNERGEDIVMLAATFLREVSEQNKLTLRGFAPEAKNALLNYPWPGNVRELKNVIQRAAIFCNAEFIRLEDLGLNPVAAPGGGKTLKDAREDVDKKLIKHYLMAHDGNLSQVARSLDIDRGTLRDLMKRYGFEKELKSDAGE